MNNNKTRSQAVKSILDDTFVKAIVLPKLNSMKLLEGPL